MSDLIRKLTSSFEQQILYARLKDGVPIEFFENKKDFTELQISYLYWLEIYSGLYSSLSTDTPYLNEGVITDEIRCDAYLKHRKKLIQEYEEIRRPRTNNLRKKRKGMPVPGVPTVVYRPK